MILQYDNEFDHSYESDWFGKPRSKGLNVGVSGREEEHPTHPTQPQRQRRTSFIILAAHKLARLFSAARIVGPARYVSTSSPRFSDALFVVSLLRRP